MAEEDPLTKATGEFISLHNTYLGVCRSNKPHILRTEEGDHAFTEILDQIRVFKVENPQERVRDYTNDRGRISTVRDNIQRLLNEIVGTPGP